MKTSRTRAAGQQTGRKAPARSTSALSPKTRAKALPRKAPEGEPGAQIEATASPTPSAPSTDPSPAPSPAHLEMAEATLGALEHLNDAQETARRLSTALALGASPRDLPDLVDEARDLAVCLDQLAAELGRCCYQLTGLGGPGPRSLAVNVRDLAAIVAGLRARLRPDQAAEETSASGAVARIAAEHFARSA